MLNPFSATLDSLGADTLKSSPRWSILRLILLQGAAAWAAEESPPTFNNVAAEVVRRLALLDGPDSFAMVEIRRDLNRLMQARV